MNIMKNIAKRKFEIELPEYVFRTLDKYGYDYIKNIAQMLSDDAYYISIEEQNDYDGKDIGTKTALEIRRQNEED